MTENIISISFKIIIVNDDDDNWGWCCCCTQVKIVCVFGQHGFIFQISCPCQSALVKSEKSAKRKTSKAQCSMCNMTSTLQKIFEPQGFWGIFQVHKHEVEFKKESHSVQLIISGQDRKVHFNLAFFPQIHSSKSWQKSTAREMSFISRCSFFLIFFALLFLFSLVGMVLL